jgi:hypothetical protein
MVGANPFAHGGKQFLAEFFVPQAPASAEGTVIQKIFLQAALFHAQGKFAGSSGGAAEMPTNESLAASKGDIFHTHGQKLLVWWFISRSGA